MSLKKVKTPSKIFTSDLDILEGIIMKTINRIDEVVGSSLGPGGRNVIIESDMPGIPNANTKDGVTIFRALGSRDAYEHLIIEQTRDAAVRTVNEAGDGPQPLYSKVLTPSGFVEMKDIEVGMKICGTNRTIQTVMGTFPKGQKEIYKVVLGDGREVECCADHLWEVTTSYGSKQTITTEQISTDFAGKRNNGDIRYKYYLPNTKVEFNDKELLMDPYLLGVLLGDGSLSDSGSIELSLGLSKKHILDKIKLPVGVTSSVQLVSKKNSYRVKLKGIRDVIKTLGLSNTGSHTKFIPKEFLHSSIENRERLLQGLLDTDGHINSRGLFEFSTVSDQLKEDFLFLARSLGKSTHYKFHTRDRDPDSFSESPIHRVTELKGYKYGEKIVDVVKTGVSTEMKCIKVSNSDHLYITDGLVVTHNTTTATIMAAAVIKNLFKFCKENRKYSPQKLARDIDHVVNKQLIPSLREQSIKITTKNQTLLKKVATISSNGDKEMADAVIQAFEDVGYGAGSHVTIQELSGPSGYNVELIEGFPVAKGYEESIGKFHTAFINDNGHQRCVLDKPLFVLFDGAITDVVQVSDVLTSIGNEYVSGNSDYANVVIVAHDFSDQVLTNFAFNFSNPNTINVVPLATPRHQMINYQLHFLQDLSAFTGAKIFDMNSPISEAQPEDFGQDMGKIEIYRFRTTIVGDPDATNIEVRAEEIKQLAEQAESKIEKNILEERLGKLTNGIARLQIFGSSNGELKEKADRAEDAVCAVRAAIKHGCLPGGGRVLMNLGLMLSESKDISEAVKQVLYPSLLTPFYRLLDNAGFNGVEIEELFAKMMKDRTKVYDVENRKFGTPMKLGIFDATLAVEQALKNAVSIASVMGTLGGIVAFPRDDQLERQEYESEANFQRTIDNAGSMGNEANERG